ncbi:hypothetical protein M2360_003502 [Rhizobium sp. SG_E_25_P2]|nr:hypothetical protein [Rhizobium sp. SG_E_25_P2]
MAALHGVETRCLDLLPGRRRRSMIKYPRRGDRFQRQIDVDAVPMGGAYTPIFKCESLLGVLGDDAPDVAVGHAELRAQPVAELRIVGPALRVDFKIELVRRMAQDLAHEFGNLGVSGHHSVSWRKRLLRRFCEFAQVEPFFDPIGPIINTGADVSNSVQITLYIVKMATNGQHVLPQLGNRMIDFVEALLKVFQDFEHQFLRHISHCQSLNYNELWNCISSS